jgi:hypothetical protein
MPRFHFPIVDGIRLEDPVGIEFPDAEAARAHAETIARHMPKDTDRHIAVVTDEGDELHQVTVRKD